MPGSDNLVRAILEMDVEATKLNKGLDEVAAKITGTSKEFDNQKKKIQELVDQEAKLIEGRSKANNPTIIAKYNNEITKVQAQIKELNSTTKQTAKETDNLGQSIKKAFTGTQLAAMKKELKALGVEFSSVSSGAKQFLKDAQGGIGQTTNAFSKLRQELKLAKGELATAFASGNQEAISKAAEKVDDLKDSLKRLGQTGSALERLPLLFRDITSNLFSLDFATANKQSKQLLETTKSITFREAAKGVGDLGGTLINIGKSLLLNPIFLLGAAIIGIIANFDKLKASGGLIGSLFKGIGAIISNAIELFFKLTDVINLTTHGLDAFNDAILKNSKLLLEQQQKVSDRRIAIARAAGLETDKLEKEQARNSIKNLQVQLKTFEDRKKLHSGLTEDEKKEELEIANTILDAKNKILEIDAASNKKRLDEAKKYANDSLKIFENLERLIREQKTKTAEFNAKNNFGEGSLAQLKEVFNIRKSLEDQAFNELQKNTLKDLKTSADKEKAKLLLTKLRTQEQINLENDKNLAVVDLEKQIATQSIERAQANELLLLSQSEDSELGIARQRLLIQTDYYDKSIKLAEDDIAKRKALGFDTTAQEKALLDLKLKAQSDSFKSIEELNKLETDSAIKQNELKESQAATQLKLQNSRHSTELDNELKFEQDKLAILDAGGKAYTEEYKRQQDKVALIEKEAIKQRRLENIGYYEQISQAAIAATDKIINIKIKEIDKQSELQQKRVDDAKNIADGGNAELLELEKERLDNLNKEKEKFVRAQQALATIELISNTAIAVSKAAAEGGVAAGVTIAATLLALVAGLAEARSIAGQAAFYEGGYTGDGNPRETSTKLGRKNYTYHKGEFVFDHEKTGKYKEIFQGVHKGNIDLGEWKDKVQMFDYFSSLNGMNTQVPKFMPPSVVNNNIEITELRGQMEVLISTLKGQQTNISLDKRGFYGSLKNVVDRDNFLSKEAKA